MSHSVPPHNYRLNGKPCAHCWLLDYTKLDGKYNAILTESCYDITIGILWKHTGYGPYANPIVEDYARFQDYYSKDRRERTSRSPAKKKSLFSNFLNGYLKNYKSWSVPMPDLISGGGT